MQLVVGRITRPHGVRGEVSVEVRTDEPERRFAVGSVLATDPAEAGPLTVASARWHTGRLLVGFTGITDRNQAEGLRGIWLTLDSAQAGSSDDPDEFHDHELIGLAVVTVSGDPVGRVTDVQHHGQDLLVIEPVKPATPASARSGGRGPGDPGVVPRGSRAGGRPPGPAPVLVPFVAAIVPEVDVAAGRLVIDPPPGLLELGTPEPGPG
jgi:16S rRNA processing protein RimM